MAQLIDEFARATPDRPALIDERGEVTWVVLDGRVDRLVNALRNRGLAVGDTVALMSANRSEFFEVFLAATHGGWVVVPVNWHWSADELAYVLENSGAKVLIVDPQFASVAAAAQQDDRSKGVLSWWVLDGDEGLGAAADAGRFERYEDALGGASPEPVAEPLMGGPMFYTSGTTGFPKGVRSTLSTTGIDAAVMQLISGSFTAMLGLPSGGVTYLNGPAYHSAQWVFSFFPLLEGSTIVMRHGFDPAEALEIIDRYGVTNTHLVPTQMIRLLRLDDDVRSSFHGSSLRVVFHGAAPCSQEVKRQMLDWWGPVVSEYYGGTEGGFLSLISGKEWLERPGSLGRPVDTVDLMITDDDGNEVPPGTSGQIWFKSKLGSDFSYHGDEEKTRAAHREGGWGTLGDIGYVDDGGYVFMSDRKIDMIISGGVNIYPAEIEGVLAGHPSVADVAVFGVPDDEMGESVMAVVQTAEGVSSGGEAGESLVTELQSHVRERLAGYKVPRTIEFRDELPRTPTGKLLKRHLRDPYWVGTGRTI